ncbi:MAG: helix-turn-helix transcriptional regulator [Oscillospiraceae bacterium]
MNIEQQAMHLIYCKEQNFSDEPVMPDESFSDFFDRMLKQLNERTGQSLSKKDIADKLKITPEMFRKYINGQKTIKKRDCIIAICAMLQADTTDTNDAFSNNF